MFYYMLGVIVLAPIAIKLARKADIHKRGGMYFWRFGRFGGTFYLKHDRPAPVKSWRGKLLLSPR
jgi:hypothetical protein